MRALAIAFLTLFLAVLPDTAAAASASEYLTHTTVGNHWNYTTTCTGTGCGSPTTTTQRVVASGTGMATYESVSGTSTNTTTVELDSAGNLTQSQTLNNGKTYLFKLLPASFSVGTTWTFLNADGYTVTARIGAINTPHSVSAGTFNDCLEINLTVQVPSSYGISDITTTNYLSPTLGGVVESIINTSVSVQGMSFSMQQHFTLTSYSLIDGNGSTTPPQTLTVTPPSHGSIASSDGSINCGTQCSATLEATSSATLTATPASGYYFAGWGGDCSGASACVVGMGAARSVSAVFKQVPFQASTTSNVTATSATINTTLTFNPADVGKQGSVFVTAWVPSAGLPALGIPTQLLQQQRVAVLGADGGMSYTPLATVDASAYVLVQRTSTGWQLVGDSQLSAFASGIMGSQMQSQNILNNINPTGLTGAQFCVGYGTDAADMVNNGRMMPVSSWTGSTSNGSCNVANNPYKGLWYNPAESGWGMSITQHNDINFVAFYTYDATSQPLWYVMSDCRISTAGKCTGDIYRVTGGVAPSAAWDGSGIAVATAGNGTITFSDANNAVFDFTLNGMAGSKTIERQRFSSGTSAQPLDFTDLWWNANESGWGVSLTQDMGTVFVAWYTYDANKLPVWYVASNCPLSNNACSGDLYKVTGGSVPTAAWAPNKVVTSVGSVSLSFSDSSHATMNYTINGATGSRDISRQPF